MTSGDFVLILNSDVSIRPGFIHHLLERAAPWQPALAAPLVVTDGKTTFTARRFPRARHQAIERIKLLGRWQGRPIWNKAVGLDVRAVAGKDLTGQWVAGVAMLLPAEILRRVGAFDERYLMYAEEVDIQRRLAVMDIPRVFLGSVVLEHVGGASTDPTRADDWLVRSRLAYAWKWGGFGRLRTLLSAATAVNLLGEVVRMAMGREVRLGAELETLRLIWANDLATGTRRLSQHHRGSEKGFPAHE